MAAIAHGAEGRRSVAGPYARASRPAELGKVAAKLAGHGADSANGGWSEQVTGDVEVLAHDRDGAPPSWADLDHPVGHKAGGATHIEGGNERVIFTISAGVDVSAGVERVGPGAGVVAETAC